MKTLLVIGTIAAGIAVAWALLLWSVRRSFSGMDADERNSDADAAHDYSTETPKRDITGVV